MNLRPLRPGLAYGLFAAILVAFFLTYYHSEIFEGPRGIHDWAQADRLALALGYYDDGMNFFRPTTFSEWTRERVTGVEAPIQAYTTALVAQVTGRASIPLVFRLLTLSIAFAGAFALFRSVFRITRNFPLAAFTPLSLFCSPATIAYSASFVPDGAALWLFMLGIAATLRYHQTGQRGALTWAMGWMALAALAKTTLALYFLPIALYLGVDRLLRDGRSFLRTSWAPMLVVLLGIGCIGGWYFHAQWLNKTYDSGLFMAKAQPFESLKEVRDYFEQYVKNSWLRDYFAWPQYGILPTILAAGLPFASRARDFESRLAWLLVTCGVGMVAAFCIMGRQLPLHDYYVLSVFYPFVASLLVVACIRLHGLATDAHRGRKALNIALVTALLFCFFFADFQYHRRISNDYPPYTYEGHWGGDWSKGGAELLRRLKIPDTARIIAAEDDPPNRALVDFDRKGVAMSTFGWGKGFEGVHKVAHEKGIRYAVYELTDYEQALHRPDSAFAQHFEVLAIEGQKVVLRLKDGN